MKNDIDNNIDNDYITQYEEWIYSNLMDEDEHSSKKDEPEEEPDEQSVLSRMRGDSTQSSKIKTYKYTAVLFKSLLSLIIVAVVIVLFIRTYYHPVTVTGPSMEPTYEDGDTLRTTTDISPERITYDTIICFTKEDKLMIKRVVGLPGDTLSFKDGQVYVNGQLREENFPRMKEYPTTDITLGNDEYYCLGDNRNNSRDSRKVGPIKFSEIEHIVISDVTKDKQSVQMVVQYVMDPSKGTPTDAIKKPTDINKEEKKEEGE